MDAFLSDHHIRLRSVVEEIAADVIAPRASEVDADRIWPEHSMRALAEKGLLGLHVPKRLGGHEEGLLALAVICEAIGRVCASSALCFGMHSVGTAVITAKATRYHEDKYLRPIAAGEHITTLALSESGTGVHFYLPQTRLTRNGDHFIVEGTKQFVTNGGHADSYVISTEVSGPDRDHGDFSCLVVDAERDGLEWLEEWSGFGMRGNSSRGVRLDGVRVPVADLLGEEGDQIWYAFEVVAPYFLVAMAGTYVGLAQAGLDRTIEHLTARTYDQLGTGLADVQLLQYRVAEMKGAAMKARGLVYHAAHQGDVGDPEAMVSIMLAKADAGDAAVSVANQAMTACGGRAYRESGEVGRILRDARASHVMAPTTDVLKTWAGRVLLGQPLL
jgi:alkylation response protein AidB-like acyl-CoA dehydrogenase